MRCKSEGPTSLAWRQLCAAMLLFTAPLAAWATGLQVSPTTVLIPANRNADGLVLSNIGQAPLHAQARVFRWTQVDGEDVLEPTTELAISPPMLELAPGGDQLVRVVRTGPPPSGAEASYRVVVDELPLEAGEGTAERAGLQFVLRYSIPVFVAPADGVVTAPVLHTRVVESAGERRIEIENLGNGRAQVSDLSHVGADGNRQLIAPGLSGYVLPGQRRAWTVPEGLGSTNGGSFHARINGEATPRVLVHDN